MKRRSRSGRDVLAGLATLIFMGTGLAPGCSGGTATKRGGSRDGGSDASCASNAACSKGHVCCDGTCELAARCECVTHADCGAEPDAGNGTFVCCGSTSPSGTPSGRCAAPEDCTVPLCPAGSGCAVPGGICGSTNRICEAIRSGGAIVDCTCQCQRGAAGAQCDAMGGCAAPRDCNTATCACECDRALGAECDPFGGCSAGESCNLTACRCEETADGGAGGSRSDGGGVDGSVGAGGARGADAAADGGDAMSSRDAGGLRDATEDAADDGAADASTGDDAAGQGGAGAGGSSGNGGSSGGGGEGSPCTGSDDCSNVCVTGSSTPPQSHVYSQVCQGGRCRRSQRLETCGLACDANRVMSQVCVAGACQLDQPVEDCGAKVFGADNETGCYQCEEKNPARCELKGVNGAWGKWVVSTAADAERGGDPDKHGQCSVDGRKWHTHYCDAPPASCGGTWCYWTTGAPGGPDSELEPEFRCGPLPGDGGT